MRDIKRIDRICKKLAQAGKMVPDERFGQFITNHLFNDGKDPFGREDTHDDKGVPKDWETGEQRIDKLLAGKGR